ncbi:hypothetical protein SAMN04488132_104289 [Sediminibacterium ginsengisoli]|uniref:GLPGLI family protein n=2 Tax=Sediminibacterium ginsengisoli TaxID=413434 RepID=A0A1T4NJZ1_9BACT|nr:hypothetical protein SAMN04488132_104289 [Sediminibacterium ginsengisoli]
MHMKKIILPLFLALAAAGYGQNTNMFLMETNKFFEDANGRPLLRKTENKVEGSPYFNESFCPGNVTMLLNGRTYKGLSLKVNLESNELLFQSPQGDPMVVVQPVKSFELQCGEGGNGTANARKFASGFPALEWQNEKTFYEVLDSGKVMLLKHYRVSFSDDKAYGSPETIRTYKRKALYYAWSPSKGIQPLAKESALSDFMADKKNQVEAYMSKEKLKGKKEEDLVKLFAFYNAL